MAVGLASNVEDLVAHARVPAALAELVAAEARRSHVSLRRLRSPSRDVHLVRLRRRIARFAMRRADGPIFSAASVGRALNRDHTTVLYYLGQVRGRG